MLKYCFLFLCSFLLWEYGMGGVKEDQEAEMEKAWALRMVHNLRFNRSKNFMGIQKVLSVNWTDPKPGTLTTVHYLPNVDGDNYWEKEFEQSEYSFFYGLGQDNMLINFGNDPDGVSYCDIGIYPESLLKEIHKPGPPHCSFKESAIRTIIKPFCEADKGQSPNISYIRATGTFNVPSRAPRCMRDFYQVARRQHEYHLLKYCAKGYFFQGKDYNDPARRNFRKDWILYLAEGSLKCNISGNVARDRQSLAKGFQVELVQKLALNREVFLHGIKKLNKPDKLGGWNHRWEWFDRDFADPHQPMFKDQESMQPMFFSEIGDWIGGAVETVGGAISTAKDAVLQHVVNPVVEVVNTAGEWVTNTITGAVEWVAKETGLDKVLNWIKMGVDAVVKFAYENIPFIRQICDFLSEVGLRKVQGALNARLLIVSRAAGALISQGIDACLRKAEEMAAKGEKPEPMFTRIQCPPLEAVLGAYEDKDRDGRFILAGIIGAGQLDAAWEDGKNKDQMFWDEDQYMNAYENMQNYYRVCYLYYNVVQRLNEYPLQPMYYNLVKQWGRYDVELRVHHHCTARGERQTLYFDVAIGPQQAPEGLHEETELKIFLNMGLLERSTGQILCDKTIENCTRAGAEDELYNLDKYAKPQNQSDHLEEVYGKEAAKQIRDDQAKEKMDQQLKAEEKEKKEKEE